MVSYSDYYMNVYASGGYITNSALGKYINNLNTTFSLTSGSSAPTRSEQFESVGFAPGTVRGTRSFKVDNLGRLTGIHYPQIWIPGENLAECKAKPQMPVEFGDLEYKKYDLNDELENIHRGYTQDYIVPVAEKPNKKWFQKSTEDKYPTPSIQTMKRSEQILLEIAEIDAQLDAMQPIKRAEGHGLDDCEHGFYAYYENSNDYYEAGRVSGVIEGYGEAILGTRGFKSQKARILALYIPSDVKVGFKVRHNYSSVPIFDSFDAMVREFPGDDGGVNPTPETHEDFWTMEA